MASHILKLLLGVLRDQTRRCLKLGKDCEPNLRGAFDLVLGNERKRPETVAILLAPDNDTHVRIPAYPDGILTVELMTVTLLGLWRGMHPNDDQSKPTTKELWKLHKQLLKEDEAALLARLYRFWSRDLGAMKTVLVESFLSSEPECPQFVAVGGARILLRQPPRPVEKKIDEEGGESDGDVSDDDMESDEE